MGRLKVTLRGRFGDRPLTLQPKQRHQSARTLPQQNWPYVSVLSVICKNLECGWIGQNVRWPLSNDPIAPTSCAASQDTDDFGATGRLNLNVVPCEPVDSTAT